MHLECLCKEHLATLNDWFSTTGQYLQCFLSEVNQHMIIQQPCGAIRSSNLSKRYLLWKVKAGRYHSCLHHMRHRNLIVQSGCYCWPRVWFCISLNQLKWLLFLPCDYTFPLPTLHQFWHLFDSSFCVFHLCWGSFEPVALQPGCLDIRSVWHSPGQAHTARDRLRLCLQMPLHILLGHITGLGYDWHTWPGGHLILQQRETLAAILRRNQDHNDSNWIY